MQEFSDLFFLFYERVLLLVSYPLDEQDNDSGKGNFSSNCLLKNEATALYILLYYNYLLYRIGSGCEVCCRSLLV